MNSKAKAKIQAFGAFLSGMVMPNIGAFIAWGLITAFFMKTGWFPNEHLDALRQPMLTYMLPSLMAYTGGKTVYGTRGAVISLIATFGAIVSADVPMFIGAMAVGPLAALILKQVDKLLKGKIPAGFEMLVNNFSLGILGMILAICAYLVLGPGIAWLNNFFRDCVQVLVDKGLLFLMPIFTEPARMLFLNNAISQGIMNPMGIQAAQEAGKSVFFLLSSNPGPGLGLLLAYSFFGKGAAKENAPTATIIHFFGGIHEVYFPYILMKPIMILSTMIGWMASNFFFNVVDAGLVAYPSPGSIISYMLMAPMGEHIKVLLGVALGAVISFVIAAFLLKIDKSEDVTQEQYEEAVALKNELKGKKKVDVKEGVQEKNALKDVKLIVFACDAGMGSSAMGASVLRNKIKKAGLDIEVVNYAVEDIPVDTDVVVCHESLVERARKVTDRPRYVTYEYLSNILGISLRTMKRNMNQVQDYLRKNNISYNIQMGKGIRLDIDEEDRQKQKKELDSLSIGFIENEERCIYILAELLLEDNYVKTEYLAAKLQVSVGTIERNLHTVQKWLKEKFLKLEKSRGKGIRIIGDETKKRTALVNLVSQWMDTQKIDYYKGLKLTLDSFKDSLVLKIREKLLELLEQDMIETIDKLIDEYDPHMKVYLTDESYVKFVVWLSLCVSRYYARDINTSMVAHDFSDNVECLYLNVMDNFHLAGLEEDVVYLKDFYRLARKQKNQYDANHYMTTSYEVVEKIIENIEKDMNIKFDRSSEFVQHFVFHLNLFMERLRKNIRITNDFLDSIKSDYANVYNSVERSLASLEFPVPEEEIGYISMHIVAVLLGMKNKRKRKKIATVCMSGISTSKILGESIKHHFPEVDVVEHVRVNEFDELKLIEQGVNLIASSVKMETDFLPIVVVNPFFKEKDKMLFKSALEQIQQYSDVLDNNPINDKTMPIDEKEQYKQIIDDVINQFYFADAIVAENIYEFMEQSAEAFSEYEEQIDVLVENFMDREKYKSTLIEDVGLALFHCRFETMTKIGVLRLKEAIICPGDESDCNVKAALVMVMPENEKGKIKNVFSEISVALLNEENFLPVLMDGNRQEIQEELRKILIKFVM